MEFQNHRVIYHIDGDAFYASVEETLHPALRQVPMAVCGDPESRRGVILSKNRLAGGFGVKTAETIWQARQKCPDLVLAPARHGLYQEFCQGLNAIYGQYTDQVERLSIDESFLDVTGSLQLFGKSPRELAAEIQARVRDQLDITVSVGISYNKIFAKMASDINKPDGMCMVTPQNYRDILWPMPAGRLYSVGRVAAEKLRAMHIATIGQIAEADPRLLSRSLGKNGEQFYRYANGLDDSPVHRADDGEDIQSVGNGRTFRRDLVSPEDIRVAVTALSDSVASRLRRKGLKCATVQVTIKDPNFKVITRQGGVAATWLSTDIAREALALIRAAWGAGNPIRMLTVTASNLLPPENVVEQLSLFQGKEDNAEAVKKEKIEKAMDSIRDKFGAESILHANIVKNDLGIHDRYTAESLNDKQDE